MAVENTRCAGRSSECRRRGWPCRGEWNIARAAIEPIRSASRVGRRQARDSAGGAAVQHVFADIDQRQVRLWGGYALMLRRTVTDWDLWANRIGSIGPRRWELSTTGSDSRARRRVVRVGLPGAALLEAIRGGCARRSMTGIAEVGPDRGPLPGQALTDRGSDLQAVARSADCLGHGGSLLSATFLTGRCGRSFAQAEIELHRKATRDRGRDLRASRPLRLLSNNRNLLVCRYMSRRFR